ncbi:MAG: hypothetical protein H8F28_04935, partial [Fibrella sp.]|nr:hypothetical protein [Armatimonadota bacterium]
MQFKHLSFVGLVAVAVTTAAVVATPAQAQFQVRVAYNAGAISDINGAEAVIANPAATVSAFSPFSVINFLGDGSNGAFGGDSVFPDGRSFTNNFALESLGRLTFNTAGSYVFRVTSDDGFRLRTGVDANGAGGVVYSEFVGQRGTGSTDGVVLNALVGTVVDTRLTFFEAGGGESLELQYSRDGGAFQLVGSTQEIAVSNIAPVTVPES